ncbi:hypothetical protein PWT90_10712 [Aphanocladium album]|nr:hypothetical protein PWT90_10712 [Aphanocladium album]
MQFKLFTLAALAAVAVADIKGALQTINKATVQLNTTVTNYSGDLLGLVPVTTDSLCLLHDIKEGTKTAKASAPLDFDAALDIAGDTGVLANVVDDVINNLIRTKPKFDRLLIVTPIIKETIKTQRSATADLSKAILSKIPQELADIAKLLIDQIDAKFAEGVKAYS